MPRNMMSFKKYIFLPIRSPCIFFFFLNLKNLDNSATFVLFVQGRISYSSEDPKMILEI